MRSILCIIIIASVLSCKQKESLELNYTEEKLQSVMIDLYIAAEAVKKLNAIEGDSIRWLYRSQIESLHDVEMEKIEQDLESLKAFPEQYKAIHLIVSDSLKNMEDYFKNEKEYGR